MRAIVDLMFRSVQQNFIEGGRPNVWPPNQGDNPILYRTGEMFRGIQLEWDAEHAKVFIDTERIPHALIHNFGGVIHHPGSDKRQSFMTPDGWITTYHTEPHDIPIPQREFMLFQDEDKTAILDIYAGAIFTQTQPR